MKLFLSWSGPLSRDIANFFEEWIRNVIQDVDTFISTKDISVGEEWRAEIDKELADGSAGVLFVTSENISSQWLHFEAGALSKDPKISKVLPLRIGVSNIDIQRSPISKFQNADISKEGMRELVGSISRIFSQSKLSKERLDKSFDKWWNEFEIYVSDRISQMPVSEKVATDPSDESSDTKIADGIADILSILRNRSRPINILDEEDKSGFSGDLVYHKGFLAKAYGFATEKDDPDDFEDVSREILRDIEGLNYEILRNEEAVVVLVYLRKLKPLRSVFEPTAAADK